MPDTLSYRETAVAAHRVASWIVRQCPSDHPCIAVIGHRALPIYPAVLGTMLASGSYVPLDPAAPVTGQRTVLEQAGVNGRL